jgi:hypothetical protein
MNVAGLPSASIGIAGAATVVVVVVEAEVVEAEVDVVTVDVVVVGTPVVATVDDGASVDSGGAGVELVAASPPQDAVISNSATTGAKRFTRLNPRTIGSCTPR